MSELPTFNFNQTIDASQAWHDKIEWRFTPVSLVTSGNAEDAEEEIQRFFYHLSCPDSFTKEEQTPSACFGWLFNPAREGRSRDIREGRFQWDEVELLKPLFSGSAQVHRRNGEHHVHFALQINTSRHWHHQARNPADSNIPWHAAESLSRIECPTHHDGEFSLDGEDNWIPQSTDYRSLWRRPHNKAPLCLRGIADALLAEVIRASASSSTEAALLSDQRHSLQYLETYWEFHARDPVRLVFSLKSILQQYARTGSRARIYRKRGAGADEWDKNCLSVTVGLAGRLA